MEPVLPEQVFVGAVAIGEVHTLRYVRADRRWSRRKDARPLWGWLKRAAWSHGRLGRMLWLRRAPAMRPSSSVWANRT